MFYDLVSNGIEAVAVTLILAEAFGAKTRYVKLGWMGLFFWFSQHWILMAVFG